MISMMHYSSSSVMNYTVVVSSLLLLVQCTSSNPKKVLVTGYEAFHGFENNPASAIANALDGKCIYYATNEPQVCYEGWSIPVNHTGASVVANTLHELYQTGQAIPWDAILHLGLEDSSKGLKLETIAMNIVATEDNPSCNVNIRNNAYEKLQRNTANTLLATTAPLDQIDLLETLRALGLPEDLEVWSRDAGAYYCNEIYYQTLFSVRKHDVTTNKSRRLLPVLFMHLPNPDAVTLQTSIQLVEHTGRQMTL